MELERRNDQDICDAVAVKLGYKDYKEMSTAYDELTPAEAEALGIRFKQEYSKFYPTYRRQPYRKF